MGIKFTEKTDQSYAFVHTAYGVELMVILGMLRYFLGLLYLTGNSQTVTASKPRCLFKRQLLFLFVLSCFS